MKIHRGAFQLAWRIDLLRRAFDLRRGKRAKGQVSLLGTQSRVAVQRGQYLWIQFRPLYCGREARQLRCLSNRRYYQCEGK